MNKIHIFLILCIIVVTFRINKSGNFALAIFLSERSYHPIFSQRSEKKISSEYFQDSYPTVYGSLDYSRCGSRIDLTRVPNNCRNFRRCIKGILFIMRCPFGTVFDEDLKVCNFPSNIRGYCGSSSRNLSK